MEKITTRDSGTLQRRECVNLDETGVFHKCMLKNRNKTCSSGKLSKEFVTLVLGENSGGTEKLLLLVIGKYRNRRNLTNLKIFTYAT